VDRYDVDRIVIDVVEVQQDHPRPGPDQEPDTVPAPNERATGKRKRFEDSQRPPHPRQRRLRQAQTAHQVAEILLCAGCDDDARHALRQLVERNALAASRLRDAFLRSRVGAWDRIQQRDDVLRIRISLIQRAREQRLGQGALLHMHAFG